MTVQKIKCPRCKKETQWEDNPSRPFCSEQCRLVDLGRWADEDYRIDGGKAPQREDNETDY